MVKKTTDRQLYNKLARLSAQGIILVILTFLGLIVGMKIDDIIGMVPTFTVGCLFVGFVIGISRFYVEAFKS